MTDKKYNIKLSVAAGLVDNYNVFNLRKGNTNDDAYNNIKVQVFIDGKEYVENSATTIIHAGESSFREFDGVLPTLQDGEWNIGQYGEKLSYKLGLYIKLPATSSNTEELYDSVTSYLNYKNQFKVEFKETGNEYQSTDMFLTYKQEEDTLLNKHYIDRTLDSLSGETDEKFMYLNTAIIHFSKYYNVYSSSSIQVPLLTPLIQTMDDLDKYGLGVDGNGMPYIANIWGHKHWAGKKGGGEHTYFINNLYSYDPNVNGYPVYRAYKDLGTRYEDCDDYYVSMFKSNYWGGDTFRSQNEEEWLEHFPKGFVVFGIENESDVGTYINSKNAGGGGDANLLYLNEYRNIFASYNYKYDFEYKYMKDWNSYNPAQVALAYYADSNGNPHIFNSWFPVKRTGADTESEKVSQEIQYKSGQGDKRPKTLGIIVASLLANIYTYKDNTSGSIGYVSDIVYLGSNTTSYIKDIIYKIRPLVDYTTTNGFTRNSNKLLLFNRLDYLEYLDKLISNAGVGNHNINYNNVNAVIKEGIKNVPLLFNINYREPNIDAINLKDSQVIVKKINGESFPTFRSDMMQSDRLYQISTDEDGNETIEYLGSNFIINFIKSITTDGPEIKAEWDTDITPIKNEFIHKMFKMESGTMIPSTSRATNRYGYYYSIATYFSGHQDNAVKDLIKEEIIIPYARIL